MYIVVNLWDTMFLRFSSFARGNLIFANCAHVGRLFYGVFSSSDLVAVIVDLVLTTIAS